MMSIITRGSDCSKYVIKYRKDFSCFGGLGLKSRSILIYKDIPINQNPIIMSLRVFTLLEVYTEKITQVDIEKKNSFKN